MDSLIAFFQNAGKYIKEKLQENFTNLQSKFNAFVEKAKFWITHPDVIINNMLSKLLGREVHLRFRLVEWIRDAFEQANQEQEEQQSPQDEEYGIATLAYNPTIAEDEKTDNWLEAALKGLSIGIPAQFLLEGFEAMVQVYNPSFDFNTWFEHLGESIQNTILNIGLAFATFLHTAWNEFKGYLTEFIGVFSVSKLIDIMCDSNACSFGFGGFVSVTSAFGNECNGKYTREQEKVSIIMNLIITVVSVFIPMGIQGEIAITAADFIANFSFDIYCNYQNGHYWGF